MSEQTIGYLLQTEVTRLNSEVARLNKEGKDRRVKGKAATAEAETLRQQVADLTADRDQWKGRAEAAPGDLQKTIEDLQGKIRQRDHRDAWTAATADVLAEKVTVATLWRELGYEPGADVPTPEAIGEQVQGLRASAPYLFKFEGATPSATDPGGSKSAGKPPLAGATPAGRGDRDTAAGAQLRLTTAQLRDPAFTLNPLNKARIAEAQKTGNLVVIDA